MLPSNPQGHEWVQEYRDKSITELEIIAALEQANCTRCFFYFRDQDYVRKKFPNPTEVGFNMFYNMFYNIFNMFEALQPKLQHNFITHCVVNRPVSQDQKRTYFVENEKCARKLALLKEKITATQKVSHFSNPKELGDLILADLKASITLDYRGR